MEDYIEESVETQEVAEPETDVEESVESQEVAEPESNESTETSDESGRTAQDAAFAEQRRRIQELEEQLATRNSENEEMIAALQRYFNGDNARDLSINANAYAEQRDPDEYRAEYERNEEFNNLKAENEELQNQLLDLQVDQLMRDGLREVQKIDPDVKSLDDLGESFTKFISSGLTTKEAYFASKALEETTEVKAPSAIGRASDARVERDYYTSEELDNLSDEEMEANWDKVMLSMKRL